MPIVAMGTTLRKGDVVIANLTSIDGIGVSSDTIETTNLSNESGYRTFVTSLKDAGEVGISGHFEYADHNRAVSLPDARSVKVRSTAMPSSWRTVFCSKLLTLT